MYEIKKFEDAYRVLTNAVDEISDGLQYYIDPNFQIITDDGYMCNELEIMGCQFSLKERRKICTRIAHFYFCEFNEETEEVYKKIDSKADLDDEIMEMIQASTGIATIINYGRAK